MVYLWMFILNSGAVNGIYGYMLSGLFFLFLYQMIKRKKIYVNMLKQSSFIMLLLFGLSHSFIHGDIQYFEYYLICPLLAYIIGWIVVEDYRYDRAILIKNVIYAIAFGYGTHAMLNLLINVGNVRWELADFYTGSIRAATGSGILNTMCFSLVAYIFILEYSKLIKTLGLVIIASSLWYAFLLGNRTQFIILIVVNLIVFLLYYHELHSLRGKMKYLVIIALIIGGGVFLFVNNTFGVKDAFWSSNLAVRFLDAGTKSSDSYRMSKYLLGLKNLIDYPFGGLITERYYHNLWLDIGRVSGIIPFACMISYSIITNVHMVKIFLAKNDKKYFRYILLAVYLGFQLNFFVEPVLEGMNEFFLCFCSINGMVDAYYYWNIYRYKDTVMLEGTKSINESGLG